MYGLSICIISFFILFFISFMSINIGIYLLLYELTYFFEYELVSLNSSMVVMTLLIDWMACFFLSFVTLISSLVILYSKDYMSGEKNMDRFILLVLMFVFSMILLIISPNLVSILLGWDGLGLVSYVLVIYYQNVKSYNAGMLTALSNRIGDVMILLSIAWMLNYGSWNFVYYLEMSKFDSEMCIIGLMIIVAAMTKSAQIPFSAWLPAAMAAPTPVSALVHSSTLVTAGVYLLIRFSNLLNGLWGLKVLLLLGGLTMFMAGLGANFEFDLKKIIALSTLSQLGLMMMILSIGFAELAFFHLLTHALFKALLFMCAGVVIHLMKNFQDIRYMGALIFQIPFTIAVLNVSNLALCGFPFLAGFYSKDLILEVSSMVGLNSLVYFLYFFSTGLTVCYSVRLMYYTMFSSFYSWTSHSIYDNSIVMSSGMIGLFIMSIIGGGLLSWVVFYSPHIIILPFSLKMMTLFVCFTGGFVGYYLSNWFIYMNSKMMLLLLVNSFVGSMWFLPHMSTFFIVRGPLLVGLNYYNSMDMGWLEVLGGQNLNRALIKVSGYFQIMQSNSLKIFLMMFLLWSMIFFMMS